MYIAPSSLFQGARFAGGIGGSDFSEGNFLGAHFAMILPFIGVMFIRGNWKSKLICLVSCAFVANSIILTRSRGVFLAIAAGVVAAVLFSIPGKRLKISVLLCIGLLGMFSLTDLGFWTRMETIETSESEMDASSHGRIKAWKAALSMVNDYPLGIGAGNFTKYVGQYDPDIPGKDTHNTFLRCLAELGIQGFVVLALLIANAFRILGRLRKQVKGWSNEMDFQWQIYGLKISIIIFITCGITMTQTYIEELYWLLIFPVFLQRSVENEAEQHG
jgi:O-antigen ligase